MALFVCLSVCARSPLESASAREPRWERAPSGDASEAGQREEDGQ